MSGARVPARAGGPHHLMLVGGRWVDSTDGDSFDVCNPATGSVIASVPRAGAADADGEAAISAFTREKTVTIAI